MQRFISFIIFYFMLLMLPACTEQGPVNFQGYAEGEFVYLSSPIGGLLEQLAVQKGDTVQKEAFLFSLEQVFEQLDVENTTQLLNQEKNTLADLKKGLRPSEIESIRARLRQAELSLKLAKTEYRRRSELFSKKTLPKEELDRAFSAFEQQKEQVRLINAELKTARLGGREDRIRASEARMKSAEAKLAQADWKLEQKTVSAPETGLVFDTYHQKGEYVPGGRPVLSLLPPENIKVRFFVPETVVSGFKTGQQVMISYDGSLEQIHAHISYISPQPEYTPPIIYSSKSRAKLVFMLEAVPDDPKSALKLHPGQPVDVTKMNGSKMQ